MTRAFLGQRALESDNPKYAAKPHFNKYCYGLFTKFPVQNNVVVTTANQSTREKSLSCCKNIVCRFLLMVRKGYRNPPYHNWSHAFTVAHFCYLLFKNAKISNNLR